MLTADSLYGPAELPTWLTDVMLTPEVQRLRGIRLTNSTSPSLAELSDARRYTHSLGVVRLASEAGDSLGFTSAERRTLAVAALCHDLGTPPFGHLFEYLLKAKTGWTHEKVLRSILDGTYRAEGIHHQILPGQELRLGRVLDRLGVSAGAVAEAAEGAGPMGRLIAGSIDLDNIDNVFRMAHLMGLHAGGGQEAVALARSLLPSQGALTISRGALHLVEIWAATRRRVYEVLAFDHFNISAQAMLTEAILVAMEAGDLDGSHWFWTDETLLERLSMIDATRQNIQRLRAGDLYDRVFLGWFDGIDETVDWRHPTKSAEMAAALASELKIPCVPYVYYDRGAFSKALDVVVVDGGIGRRCHVGTTSVSTVVAVVSPRRRVPAGASAACRRVLSALGFDLSSERRLPQGEVIRGGATQQALFA